MPAKTKSSISLGQFLIKHLKNVIHIFILVTVIPNSPLQKPLTRKKGEIACFSCFAKNSGKVSVNSRLPQTQTMQNLSEIISIITNAGMNIPVLVNRCEDTIPILNPNFYGANIHICPNSDEEPGACVKFKGYYKGEAFVYRECWDRMWKDPRPFQHRMSGACFSDDFVQSFVQSERNTICFCEDDLCNSVCALNINLKQIIFTIFIFLYYFHL